MSKARISRHRGLAPSGKGIIGRLADLSLDSYSGLALFWQVSSVIVRCFGSFFVACHSLARSGRSVLKQFDFTTLWPTQTGHPVAFLRCSVRASHPQRYAPANFIQLSVSTRFRVFHLLSNETLIRMTRMAMRSLLTASHYRCIYSYI